MTKKKVVYDLISKYFMVVKFFLTLASDTPQNFIHIMIF